MTSLLLLVIVYTDTHTDRMTDRKNNFLISSNVHYVHLAKIIRVVICWIYIRFIVSFCLRVQNMLKSAAQTQKQINLVKLHEQSKNNMEQEILNYKEEAQKQRKIIYQLEKERDRYINEASDLTQKVCSSCF